MRFRLVNGIYVGPDPASQKRDGTLNNNATITYRPGAIVESDTDLARALPNQFQRLDKDDHPTEPVPIKAVTTLASEAWDPLGERDLRPR